jgi:hypothetical protein
MNEKRISGCVISLGSESYVNQSVLQISTYKKLSH